MGRIGPAAGLEGGITGRAAAAPGLGTGALAGIAMGGRPGQLGRPDIQARIAAAPASAAGLAASHTLYCAACPPDILPSRTSRLSIASVVSF